MKCDCGKVELTSSQGYRLEPYSKWVKKMGVATAVKHAERACWKVDYRGDFVAAVKSKTL